VGLAGRERDIHACSELVLNVSSLQPSLQIFHFETLYVDIRRPNNVFDHTGTCPCNCS